MSSEEMLKEIAESAGDSERTKRENEKDNFVFDMVNCVAVILFIGFIMSIPYCSPYYQN